MTNQLLVVAVLTCLIKNSMFKTIIRFLTPFIVSVSDIICGVMFYLRIEEGIDISYSIRNTFSHCTGSSILLILYILATLVHMCKYYKSCCLCLLFFHVLSILYIYTDITTLQYVYATWIFSVISLILWTISVLGYKTFKTIHQACKHSETK